MDVLTLLRGMGGAATWSELQAKGVRRGDLQEAMARQLVVRRGRGIYAVHDIYAPAIAARWRGVVSHQSAAWMHNYGLVAPYETHITVRRNHSSRVPDRVVLHYGTVNRDAGLVTSPLQTAIDCARSKWIPLPHALAICEAATRDGVSRSALEDAATVARGPGSGRLRTVIGWLDESSQSVLESALRGILLEAGITRFQAQFRVMEGGRLIATVDLGDGVTGILLEADSFKWHGDRLQLARDAERYDELAARGFLVLRFAWEHIVMQPAWVLDTVRRAIDLRLQTNRR